MKDFLSIGSVSVDLFLEDEMFKENNLCNLETGFKYDMQDYFIRVGGSAYNTAKLFSSFGFKTSLMSCVSEKYYGKLIYQKVKKQRNLSAKFLEINKNIKTSFSVILLSLLKERTILKYSAFAKGFHFNENNLKGYKVICLSSLNGREDVLEKVFEYKKNNNVFLTSNPGKKDFDFLKNNLEYLKLLDVLVLNNIEASMFSGINKENILEILNYFSDKVGIFIMTMGNLGSYICIDGKQYKCGIYKGQKVKDMTGAGDAFYSAFVMAYYKYKDLKIALKYACANAYEVVGEIGSSENLLTNKKYMSDFWKRRLDNLKIELIHE